MLVMLVDGDYKNRCTKQVYKICIMVVMVWCKLLISSMNDMGVGAGLVLEMFHFYVFYIVKSIQSENNKVFPVSRT